MPFPGGPTTVSRRWVVGDGERTERPSDEQSLSVTVGLLLLLVLLVLVSILGWRWNQLEVARSSRPGRRMVKWTRGRSGRRKLPQLIRR